MTNPYPIGSYYSRNDDINPATLFGGTWQLISTKMPIGENVFGNGKGFALTGGTKYACLVNFNPDHTGIISGSNNSIGKNVGSSDGGSWQGNDIGKILGVPTKTQLGDHPENSGLIMESIVEYKWLRIA